MYDEDDILRLELIHTMRLLDVPVAEIRRVLGGDTPIGQALQQALGRTTEQIQRLEEDRLSLRSLLHQERLAAEDLGDQVRRLQRTVEQSSAERSLHLEAALKRIFPGPFGRFMALLHAPFFDIELDTEERKVRWLRFVAYLDDLQEPPADHPYFQLAHVEDEAAVAAYVEGQREHVSRLIAEDVEAIATLREATAQFLRTIAHDPHARRRHADRLATSKDLWESIGGSGDEGFNEHLTALNDDYRRYLAIGQRIREEAERAVGFRLDEPSLADPT